MKNLRANSGTSMMNNSHWRSHCSVMLMVSLATIFNASQSHASDEPARTSVSASENSVQPVNRDSLQSIFERVEKASQADIQRYQELKVRKKEQLTETNAQVAVQQTKLQALNNRNAQLEEQILQLQQKLQDKQKQVKAAKADIVEVIDLTSAQQRNFLSNNRPLATWAKVKEPQPVDENDFSIATIHQLWIAMIQQISASSEPREHVGEVLLPNGEIKQASIQQVGAFSQFAEGYGWLSFDGARQLWIQLFPQPQLVHSNEQWLIDPAFGFGFLANAKQPKWYEAYLPAGIIGLLIALLAVIGFSIGLARLFSVTKEKKAVKHQALKLSELSEQNMLGRVLLQLKGCTTDQQIEDVIDANISREMPWLNKGIGTLAVLAAIAPLMGLLGTVGGMIETFSVITSQGVTDGELLSGGIAEALLTTKLGLLVAIPLLILHCLVKTQAQQLSEILEHQVTSLVVDIRYGKQA
ncbi:MotA/TolQ/ExbB proton channel family protein [Vibrio sp.]|uniref:MotA/TolQ/ExbB proton channel family protein n=1 Tax=Vibrio sp. TaxID=678 RepID=UPI003F6A74C2